MRRRQFLGVIGGAAAVAWPLAARAQSTTVARVGFLRQAGPDDKHFDAFRGGLRAAGYIEGRNIIIEQRYADGAYDRLRGLVMELVRSNVDVIVVDGTAAAKACKDGTATIPVVFTLAVDPVADGLAASFAHPGGNLTGLTMALTEVIGAASPISDFGTWLRDRKNRRAIPHRFNSAGYVPVRNETRGTGLWVVGGVRQVVYAKKALSVRDRLKAVQRRVVGEAKNKNEPSLPSLPQRHRHARRRNGHPACS